MKAKSFLNMAAHALLIILMFTSCNDKSFLIEEVNDDYIPITTRTSSYDRLAPDSTINFHVLLAFPDKKPSEIITLKDGTAFARYDSTYVIGGDVILTQEQVDILTKNANRERSAPMESTTNYWPLGKVYYTFDASIPIGHAWRALIQTAIADYTTKTSLIFQQRTNEPNYIVFKEVNGNVSSSQRGMIGGAQDITLGNLYREASTAIHEIGHAIGLGHEHVRPDRDTYVNIHLNMILSGKEHNFTKWGSNDGYNHGAFDFNSVMIYNSYAFTKDEITPSPTMTRKNGDLIFMGSALSSGDVEGIKFIYGPPYLKVHTVLSQVINEYFSYTHESADYIYSNYLRFYNDRAMTQEIFYINPATPRLIHLETTVQILDYGNPPYYSTLGKSVLQVSGNSLYYLFDTRLYYYMAYGNYMPFYKEDVVITTPNQ